MKKEDTKENIEKIENIENKIGSECEDMEWEKITKVLGKLETIDGSTDNKNIWKETRKAYPKKVKPLPTGVKNIEGKLITNVKEKKNVILDHFHHRMRR